MPNAIENFNLVEGINLSDVNFSKEEILQAQLVIRQYLSDFYTDLDFSELSSLNDVVIRPMSQIFLVIKSLIEQFNKTNTLLGAMQVPEASSDKIVDALLSNFSTYRNDGGRATGTVKILLKSGSTNFLVDKSIYFSITNGLRFYPQQNYVVTKSPNTSTDLKIYSDSSSLITFVLVPVIAETYGSTYNIQEYTPLALNGALSAFQSAIAFSDFFGGKNKETNDSVINRLIPSLSARNLASPVSIKQTLKDKFPSITQINIHGINSDLMTRNSYNIFGIKCGSYCDVYIKTSNALSEASTTKIASRITSDPNMFPDYYNNPDFIGKYLIKIKKEDLPGFYSINRVTPLSNDLGSYRIIKTTRGYDQSKNTIHTTKESVYSIYSTAEIIFDAGIITNNNIEVVVFADSVKEIKEIQDFVNEQGAQSVLFDTLVKACVPCYISTSEIKVKVKASTVSAESLQFKVIEYINSIDPSVEEVRVDGIISCLISDKNIISIDIPIIIKAKILSNTESQEIIEISSESSIKINDRIDLGFSKRNIAYYCRNIDIPLTIIEI